MTTFLNDQRYPRGFRNNNPGNLIQTSIPWNGKLSNPNDSRFEQFKSFEHGYRAMIMDVLSDIQKGQNTIRKLIAEYAPEHENDTEAYIQAVATRSGIPADEPLARIREMIKPLTLAMIYQENGLPAPEGTFERAWSMVPDKKKFICLAV